LCRDYPISVHTVGISIGSATGIDRSHLKRIRTFIEKIQPVLVSGHLAWSSYGSDYLNDLLPLPLDAESLKIAADHISEVQDCWGRPYLIENPASYVGFCASTISEPDFLSELVRRTGCKLLCDVSNSYVSAHNMGTNAYEYIDSLPGDAIAEIHLGGYTPEEDVLIDTHAAAIADPAWDLYAYAIRRFGPKPTLIEWDNDIPPLAAILKEAAHAKMISSGNPEERHAAAG